MSCHVNLRLVLLCVCTGEVIITPSRMAYVCIDGQVELTCSIPGRFLEWRFSLTPENASTSRDVSRLLESTTQSDQSSTTVISSIAFTFSRTSAPYSLPLMSRLLFSNASVALNGTVVSCVDRITSDTSSTVIRVVSQSQDQGR